MIFHFLFNLQTFKKRPKHSKHIKYYNKYVVVVNTYSTITFLLPRAVDTEVPWESEDGGHCHCHYGRVVSHSARDRPFGPMPAAINLDPVHYTASGTTLCWSF